MREPNDCQDSHQWYCVRTRPKSEHIAAAHLRLFDEVEVFCPRIRFKKATRRGKVWFVEALFPGYILARFDLMSTGRAVASANAVTKLVRFGDDYPVVDAKVIADMRDSLDEEQIVTIEQVVEPGDEVEVLEGPLQGMKAVVTRLLPAKERVRILLEFLGGAREVEVSQDLLLGQRKNAKNLAPS